MYEWKKLSPVEQQAVADENGARVEDIALALEEKELALAIEETGKLTRRCIGLGALLMFGQEALTRAALRLRAKAMSRQFLARR